MPGGLAALRSRVVEVATTQGTGRAHVLPGRGRSGRLLLGHGAGGGVDRADLTAVAAAAAARDWSVALVEQPWRVAGRRVATAPARLDEAWLQLVVSLLGGNLLAGDPGGGDPGGGGAMDGGGPLVLGGRSAGARVACRTAQALAAAGVMCLAFPLHPPGRPERSRLHELPVGVRTLVVQGRRDPFGSGDQVRAVAPPGVDVVDVDGGHGLYRDVPAVVAATTAWLDAVAHPEQ